MDLRYLEVPIGALDTAGDPTNLPPGALTIADNCSADTPGIYEKRKGFNALATPGVVARLASHGNQLLSVSPGGTLQGFDGVSVWRALGFVTFRGLPDAQTSQATIELDQVNDVTMGTRATASGVTVHAFVRFGFMWIRLVEVASGAVIYENSSDAATVFAIHAVVSGSLVLVFYTTNAQTLRAVKVDCAARTVAAAVSYQSGANVNAATPWLDVCPLNATDVLVAWYSNTPDVRVARVTAATIASAAGPTAISAEVVNSGLGMVGTSGEFGAILYQGTAAGGMRAACFNPATTAQTVAPFMVEAVTAPAAQNCGLIRVDATHVLAVWDRAATGITKQKVQWVQISSAGVVSALCGPLFNVALASKPFPGDSSYGGTFKALNVWAPYNLQYTYATVRIQTTSGGPACFPTAMHAYRTAYKSAQILGQLTDVDDLGSSSFAFSASISYKFLSTTTPRAGWATFGVDYRAATLYKNVEAIGDTFFAAGIVGQTDGFVSREVNFIIYPEITQATAGAVGGAGMDNGTYSYVAVFESSDGSGNTDRSTPSIPVSATTSAGAGLGKVTLTIDQLGLTRVGPDSSIMGTISLFRTLAGGTTYRFIGTIQMRHSGASDTYVDQAHDSTISSNRILYTDGGVLEREPPPPAMQLIVHKNRMWGFSSADRRVLFYSGELGPGEAPWFSSLQQIRIDAGGDIAAIASMDDKLVVYKSDNRIFKIYGSGMNALGQNNDLSAPLPVNTDGGASDWRSVVSMSDGTMYRNKKGIQLLVRGEETGYIGAPVESYVDAAANVTAAVLLADAREIRFELDTGKKVVFNYGTKRWTTHSNYQGSTAVDAIVVGGRYYWATAAGGVYQEKLSTDTGPFLDPASTFVPMTIEAAWLAPAGRQGLARMRKLLVLAERLDPHDLTITTSVNYDTATPPLVSPLTDAVLATLPREQIRVSLTSEKIQSVRVKTVDAAAAGTVSGQGYKLRGFGFMAGVKKGAFDKRMVNAAKV